MSDAYEMEIADLREDIIDLKKLLGKKDKEIFELRSILAEAAFVLKFIGGEGEHTAIGKLARRIIEKNARMLYT